FQRLVPADALPAGVGIAFGPCALAGVEQALLVVDQLGRRAALGADGLARRMQRIGLEGHEAAVLDNGGGATAGDTQGAVGGDALRGRRLPRHDSTSAARSSYVGNGMLSHSVALAPYSNVPP